VGLRPFDPDAQKPKGFQLGPFDPGDAGAYDDIFDDPDPDENPPS
jgi:hypothetical protein